MSALFEQLAFFDDREPHPAALNMAIDEALLRQVVRPTLRIYRWIDPAVSIGYFEKWELARTGWPEREIVRRWTGGGNVLHGDDLTYSLLVPSVFNFAKKDAVESYQLIHLALASTMRLHCIPALTYEKVDEKTSRACFQNPVRHDLLVNGEKIAGAAQRRTRFGLLHQGSVQGLSLPESFGQSFGATLSSWVEQWNAENILISATPLAQAKYANREWLQRF